MFILFRLYYWIPASCNGNAYRMFAVIGAHNCAPNTGSTK